MEDMDLCFGPLLCFCSFVDVIYLLVEPPGVVTALCIPFPMLQPLGSAGAIECRF